MRRIRLKVGRAAPIAVALLVALALAVPALALGAFPGPEPPPGSFPESPRVNTPDDPEFDRCEADDETTPGTRECTSYFNEQYGLFGFAPDSSTAIYLDPAQLDDQGRDANVKAGDLPLKQISGVRADTAWKYSVGSPDVSVAILDTGIRWEEPELVDKVRLNTRELPRPQGSSSYDRNGDGKVSVSDYADDPRVRDDGGDEESDAILDGSDLIAAFSDRTDADRNGYVDDIAGWDFFDDDNDPFDVSSCCSADDHGTGRAIEAGAATNNAKAGAGVCPECQIVPMRVWDTFVVDTNLFALATTYAADNGVSVVEGAVGGLLNSSFARRAFRYADRKGVTLTLVSSDLNTANHNYPTNYNEAIYVGGTLPDTAPADNCEAPGVPGGPDLSSEECANFISALGSASGGTVQPSPQPPTTSFFRNANLTQYGGKADIVLVGATGSQNTGQASGAAALLQSYGRERFGGQGAFPKTLSGNEVRQLLTMSAEDVKPGNTGQIGLADKANDGWDPHFGYGRVNLTGAMRMIQAGRIPPEAQIGGPDWFAPIDVNGVGEAGVPIRGRVAAPHSSSGPGAWRVEYACGQDAKDTDFQQVPGAAGSGAKSGELGRLPKALLSDLAANCDGSIANDPGLPAGQLTSAWPADPYPSPDPHKHAFQIRLTASEAADPANVGRYRKTLFAYRDDTLKSGFPKPLGDGASAERLTTGTGGEASPRLVDLDGDNRLEFVVPTSSGELNVLRADGRPLASFNGGRPVRTRTYAQAAAHRPTGPGALPREPLRTPAVGDITGDGEPEIVATAGERIYAWSRRGKVVRGFPRRIDPARSTPCKGGVAKPCFDVADRLITREDHIKRGFIGSPALADLDEDGRLDVVAGSLDQHVYAVSGRGRLLPGFPVELTSGSAAEAGAEIVNSPAIADLDGDDDPEVVLATNELLKRQSSLPSSPDDFFGKIFEAAAGSSVTYAIHGNGKPVRGWPVRTGVLLGDVLPLVGPGHDAAALDTDGDGKDEVSTSATTGDAKLVRGDGSTARAYQAGGAGNALDPARQLNLFEYSSVGDLLGGGSPSVIKGGVSLNGLLNLAAPNQNFPFNHTVQAWDPETGLQLPGFPRATDDFQLLSQPAIARVAGSGPGRQALVGTGLYQLHAYGPLGEEPAGWPKFTGGWNFATPSVGDVDGDGKLEVALITREGFSFLWNTSAPACGEGAQSTNQEWWTSHHDEFGTANYGTDARPPSRPGVLAFRAASGASERVSFAASGDDLLCGAARRYEVRGSNRPIASGADFTRATRLSASGGSTRAQAGRRISLTVRGARRFRNIAVRAVDDAGNVSFLRGPTAAQRRSRGRGPSFTG